MASVQHVAVLLSTLVLVCKAQQKLIYPDINTWNSSFKLTAAQIKAANLTNSTAHNVEVALDYELTNNAGGPIGQDQFYLLPDSFNASSPPPAGTVLRVEEYTNTSLYTLAPSLSMSRILYTTETLNGTVIPASAYVLWPYTPRSFPNLTSYAGQSSNASDPVFPIIAYPHGSSGQNPGCATSHLRNLWDNWAEPFPMALAGYAVVAPDYAGLGVSAVPSPYFVLPSQANDLIFAVEAAQKAFPNLLSENFVIAGQSQGGGVAWSAAQRQEQRPVDGYLGAVAASPFTDVLAAIAADAEAEDNVRVVGIAQGLDSVLPNFTMSEWITDAGVAKYNLLREIGGCGTTANYLLSGADGVPILKDGWNLTQSAKWYADVSDNGGKPFVGPMLVIQGTLDPNANVNATTASVQQTCSMFPNNSLHYIQYEGITHVPVLYAGQHLWLDWVQDRFNGVDAPAGCQQDVASPVRGITHIDKNINWFIEFDEYWYE